MVDKCTRAFVRQLDDLGRLVLPIEWRREFGVGAGVPMELVPVAGGKLVIQRYIPQGSCLFCGSMNEIRYFAGRAVCTGCAESLSVEVLGTTGGSQGVEGPVSREIGGDHSQHGTEMAVARA